MTVPPALWLVTAARLDPIPWPAEARTLDDATRLLPAGLYTTFRTFDRKRRVLGLRRHLGRLYPSPDLQPTPDRVRAALRQVLAAFPAEEARVRLVMVPGQGCYVLVEPLPVLPDWVYQQGVTTVTVPLRRPRPREKRTGFIAQTQALRARLQREGHFEVLLAACGRLREGMTSNFFWVREGRLYTAGRGVLPGVTRHYVLCVARKLGVPIGYRMLPWTEIPHIDEAFLTSSSRGLVPIVQIDGLTVGDGRPGPLTRRLAEAYMDYVLRVAERI